MSKSILYTRLFMVSHISSILLEDFPVSQTTRTQLFNQGARVASIIQSIDLHGGQSNFIHSRRTRDTCEAAGLVTRVVASLKNCLYARYLCLRDALSRPSAARDDRISCIQTNCMTQNPLNSPYKLSVIDSLW